jgi:hypothetical protein
VKRETVLAAVVCVAMTLAGATSVFAQARNYPESYLRYAGDPTKQIESGAADARSSRR